MKILVIGSKGFIGTHCVNNLSKDNHLFGCDVVNDFVSSNYFQIDATNADYKDIFRAQYFDVCINCSGAASVPESFKRTGRDFTLNTANVVKLLEAIRDIQPHCKFINLSSAAVYGNQSIFPIREDFQLEPLSPYALHKKFSEEIVSQYARLFNLNTCSLRIFSVFGPGLRKQFFWDLHNKIVSSSRIQLWGTGNESRDFIYIADVVDAIKCTIEKADFRGESINISTGVETSIKDVVDLFRQMHFIKFDYTFDGRIAEGYPSNSVADVGILRKLGFNPQYSLQDGLGFYIDWLERERRKEEIDNIK